MARIRNMGTATMRFGEGVIVTGSASNDTHSLIVEGEARVTNNFNVTGDGAFDNAYVDDELVVGTVYNSLKVSGSAFLSSSNDVYSGDGSGNYSVSLWYKSADQVAENRIIFTLANSNARSTVREKGGALQFLASADDNSTCVSGFSYFPDEADNWNFLTFVSKQNGANLETTASLNGAITDTDSVAGKTAIMNYASNTIRKLQIAGYTSVADTIGNEMFIRDFILWDGSLSADDITTLYNGGNPYNFRNFTTYDKLAWLKPDQINATSFDGSSSTIINHGSVGGIFEVADYDVGEIVEVNTDAPFTDPTGNSLTVSTDALVHGDLVVSGSARIHTNLTASGIQAENDFTIGSQQFFAQSTNGFSVNEDYDASNDSNQTAYHFTSGQGRESVTFTVARTGQFTNGFGITGSNSNNTFVSFGEQANTNFEWRNNVGIRPVNLTGGNLLARLESDGYFILSGSADISGSLSLSNVGTFQLSGSNILGLDADNEMHVTAGGVLSYKVKNDGNVEFQTAVTSSHFKVEGSGGQFVAFNEDTVKLKHVNWYSSNDRQYGQGQLWYQQWFGAIEPSDSGAQGGRRIGFFFYEPNKGASDADGGSGAHPTNTHMYLDLNGMYLQTGSFIVNQGDAVVSGSLKSTDLGPQNEIVIVGSDNALSSSNLLTIDPATERIGIGTTSPSVKLDMVGEASGETQIRMAQHHNGSDGPDIRFFTSRGTADSPTAVANDDNIGRINSFAYNGTSYVQAGTFGWDSDGTDGDSTFNIRTRVGGNTADRLEIDASGNVSIPGDLYFEDFLIADLSISGLDLQTDTNAFRFNCPYNLTVEGLQLYLDQHTTSGNVTVTVTNTTDTNQMISLSITGTNTSASTTTVSNQNCDSGDIITFAITATPANAQGLRANLQFRRRG